MRARKKAIVFFLTLITIAIASCTKETGTPAKCKLVRIKYQQPQGASIDITYNNDGKVSTLKMNNVGFPDRAYNYFGNTIVVTHGGPGNYIRDTIIVDDKERPVNIRKYSSGPSMTDYQLEYNGDDLARVIVTRAISGIPHTATADYLNGNMISYTYGGQTIRYEYYTDKNFQVGDYLHYLSLMDYGINIYPNKNLIKGIDEPGSGITNYTYEFNSDGLVTQVTRTNGPFSSFITYQYACD